MKNSIKLQNKKTGFIGYIEYNLSVIDLETGNRLLTVRYKDDSGVTCYKDYDTIDEFNKDWKDYKIIKPLIKDKKIRKLVRDWSKLYDNNPIRVYKRGSYISLYKDGVIGYSTSVGIDLPIKALREVIDDHYYTITALCGDENYD